MAGVHSQANAASSLGLGMVMVFHQVLSFLGALPASLISFTASSHCSFMILSPAKSFMHNRSFCWDFDMHKINSKGLHLYIREIIFLEESFDKFWKKLIQWEVYWDGGGLLLLCRPSFEGWGEFRCQGELGRRDGVLL